MHLADLIADPLAGLVHLERFVNDGSPSGLTFAEHQVRADLRPREGGASFALSVPVLPWDEVELCVAAPDPAVRAAALYPDGVALPLHPQVPDTLPAGPRHRLQVVPTASGRTVLVPGPDPYYLKLHYPDLLGRVPRHLDRKRVRASVRMSAELDLAARAGSLAPPTAYLAEPLGAVTGPAGAETGVVYREYLPRPLAGYRPVLVPFFALWSTDLHAPQDPPLLVQLLGGRPDPVAALCGELLAAVLDSYANLCFGLGLVPEDHGQNLLLELDLDGAVRRVVRRDLLDWYADVPVRAPRRYATDFSRVLTEADGPERVFGGRSYAFDFRLGEYILDPLVDLAVRYWDAKAEALRDWIRERVHGLAERYEVDLREYFQPWDTVYYYQRSLRIWENGAPLFARRDGVVYR